MNLSDWWEKPIKQTRNKVVDTETTEPNKFSTQSRKCGNKNRIQEKNEAQRKSQTRLVEKLYLTARVKTCEKYRALNQKTIGSV